jgi:peptidoglycan/LPS O-acetylase OafA/YrhL
MITTQISRRPAVETATPAAPPAAVERPRRRHDIDALRVLAVLLLIPFHSARVFDVFDPFYVKNAQTHGGLSWAIVAFLDTWHMPLLFALAGASTWLALRHRSGRGYVRERFLRLMVPFVFGLLVIVPPQAFLARAFRGAGVSLGAFLGDYWTVEGDLSGYTGDFTPGHLWFIGSLFLLSVGALPLFLRWRRREMHVRWLLFAMPVLLFVANQLPATEDGTQSPWYAFAVFAGGFLLMADQGLEAIVHRHWRRLAVAGAATMATVLLIASSGVAEGWTEGSAMWFAKELFSETNTWIWVLALLGAGHAYLNADRPILRWAAEASYPFYILHQTVIVAVAYAVVGWNLGVVPKFAAVVIGSLGLSIALYELCIRRWRPMRFLFGMKAPRPAVRVVA